MKPPATGNMEISFEVFSFRNPEFLGQNHGKTRKLMETMETKHLIDVKWICTRWPTHAGFSFSRTFHIYVFCWFLEWSSLWTNMLLCRLASVVLTMLGLRLSDNGWANAWNSFLPSPLGRWIPCSWHNLKMKHRSRNSCGFRLNIFGLPKPYLGRT